MEIKLRKEYGSYKSGTGYGNTDVSVCVGSFRRIIDVPANNKICYAVFSKTDTKPRASLTIKSPTGSIQWRSGGLTQIKVSKVEETRADLSTGTMHLLATAYAKGYRFVHFEFV